MTAESNVAIPLCEIECYKESYRGFDSISITDTQIENVKKIIHAFNPSESALNKHMLAYFLLFTIFLMFLQ